MKKFIVPGLVAGVVMLIVGMLVGQLLHMIFPQLIAEYQNPNLFRPWDDPLMSIYFAHPFIVALALAWVWGKVKGLISGSLGSKATHFALGYWVVATIPGMVISYASFPLSLLIICTWTISSLVQAICAGLVFAKMNP